MQQANLGKRGQAFILDIIVALLIFFVGIGALVGAWSLSTTQLEIQRLEDDLSLKATIISDLLVLSPPSPEEWTPSSLRVVGLSTFPRALDASHVDQFLSLSYDTMRDHFGLSLEHFALDITSLNGTSLVSTGQTQGTHHAVVTRYAWYHNQTVRLEVTLSR